MYAKCVEILSAHGERDNVIQFLIRIPFGCEVMILDLFAVHLL